MRLYPYRRRATSSGCPPGHLPGPAPGRQGHLPPRASGRRTMWTPCSPPPATTISSSSPAPAGSTGRRAIRSPRPAAPPRAPIIDQHPASSSRARRSPPCSTAGTMTRTATSSWSPATAPSSASELSAIRNIRTARRACRCITLEEGDELIAVLETDGEQDNILIATHDGMAICFRESDVRRMGRDRRGRPGHQAPGRGLCHRRGPGQARPPCPDDHRARLRQAHRHGGVSSAPTGNPSTGAATA